MGTDQQALTAEQVIHFLEQHPNFFSERPEALEYLDIANAPQGTVSLVQKQVERLRHKNERLSEQLDFLIENARQNGDLQTQVHQLCLQLMDTTDVAGLMTVVCEQLKQEFNADQVSVRLFYHEQPLVMASVSVNVEQIHVEDDCLQVFEKVLDKHQPLCGRLSSQQKKVLFGDEQAQISSIACIPMGHEPCAGFLAIASHDADRFHSDMATDYLAFLGEVLMRLIRFHHHS